MSKRLVFRGSGDDTFGDFGSLTGIDFDNCAAEEPIIIKLESGPYRLLVVGHYWLTNGCWTVGLSLVQEDDEFPPWPSTFIPGHGYSTALAIDVPDDTTLTRWHPNDQP